jgi:hypothetical protein
MAWREQQRSAGELACHGTRRSRTGSHRCSSHMSRGQSRRGRGPPRRRTRGSSGCTAQRPAHYYIITLASPQQHTPPARTTSYIQKHTCTVSGTQCRTSTPGPSGAHTHTNKNWAAATLRCVAYTETRIYTYHPPKQQVRTTLEPRHDACAYLGGRAAAHFAALHDGSHGRSGAACVRRRQRREVSDPHARTQREGKTLSNRVSTALRARMRRAKQSYRRPRSTDRSCGERIGRGSQTDKQA